MLDAGPSAPRSLLLVDAGQRYCALVEQLLRQARTGTAVWPKSSGQDAIEYLALAGTRHPVPDLVLLDRRFREDPDGYAVLRAVRALAHLADVPIIMVSGSSEPEDIQAALDAGANAHIIKPPEESAYPELVRQVLGWWSARQEEKMLRDFCVALTPGKSPGELARIASGPAMQSPAAPFAAAAPENPLTQIARHLGDFFGYLTGGNLPHTSGLFVERKLMEITLACREVGIDERHARGKSQDSVIVEKRGRVIKRLMAMEWSNTELLERFEVRKRTIVELRRQYREELQKSCAVVARAPR